ncbi:M48 family metalloprotease [Leptothrix discophora]|uniref:M48 family metalloprotease n=1 Tax=Leptothrix discophora TaxID=89 RepID=A0ABT9G922_LEPDI|nr:M48 family metalloprotease [Leptothrix discophora]MDP4302822.1 M48 family metalloprotease [Leptothrix discophora]
MREAGARHGHRTRLWQPDGRLAGIARIVILCAGIAGLTPASAARAAPELAEPPVALAWSTEEIDEATRDNAAPVLDQARRRDQFGCRRHCELLQQVFDRLVARAREDSPRAARIDWRLSVVRGDAVEAMALPGGHVIVSESFIDESVPGEDALAFVLAHEMAHSILEHERQALTYARMLLPRQVPRTVADVYVEIDHNLGLLKAMEPVMQQGELEADELGLLLAASAGHDPQHQVDFLRRAVDRGEPRRALVQTHPALADRLARLEARLPLAARLHRQALDER